jgi:hypothetical protein
MMVLGFDVPKEGLDQFGWQDSEAARSRKGSWMWKVNKEGISQKDRKEGRQNE